MEDLKLHRFEAEIGGIEVPARLNNPFEYAPHPLAVLAAEQVKRYVRKVFIHKKSRRGPTRKFSSYKVVVRV